MEDMVKETLRYLGVHQADDAALRSAEEAVRQVKAWVRPRYVYRVFPAVRTDEAVLLPACGLALPGRLAREMLAECPLAVILLCTLGAEFDRRLLMAQARDMARAALLDACGSAYAEAGCGEAEKEIAGRFPSMYLTDRFSPGYGDLPLRLQPALLRAVDGERRLGVTAAPSCMLTPMKTVTAVIGLSSSPREARIRGCACCARRNGCAYRERGTTCEISC